MTGFIVVDNGFIDSIPFEVGKTYNIKDYNSLSRFEYCQTPMDLMRNYDLDSYTVAEVEILGGSVYLGDGIYGTDEYSVMREVDLDTLVAIIYHHIENDIKLLQDQYNCSITATPFTVTSLSKSDSTVWTTGESDIAANSGYNSTAYSYRKKSIAASTGDGSKSTALFSQSVAVSTGLLSCAKVNKPHSVAVAIGDSSVAEATIGSLAVAGPNCCAQGKIGSWLILTEASDNLIDCRSVYVDGSIIKADTLYVLTNGKVVKLSDD